MLSEVTFPLSGTFADISVALESIIIFISFQWFFQFLVNYINASKKDRSITLRRLSWSIIILGMGITYFIYIIGDFVLDPVTRTTFNQFGYLSLASGAMGFYIINEQLDHVKFRLFTAISVIIEIIIIICLIKNYQDTVFIASSIAIPSVILYLIYYGHRLMSLSSKNRVIIRKIMKIMFGFAIAVLGYLLISDSIVEAFGIAIRVVGDILLIIGMTILQISMKNLPDLSDYDWIQSLKSILVIHSSGISLFARFYQSEESEAHKEYLISGALNSINALLEKMTGNEQVNTINLPDKCVMIEYAGNLKFALISDKFLLSLQVRLKQFAEEFESFFKDYLVDFSGLIDIFLPAEAMVDRIFKPI